MDADRWKKEGKDRQKMRVGQTDKEKDRQTDRQTSDGCSLEFLFYDHYGRLS